MKALRYYIASEKYLDVIYQALTTYRPTTSLNNDALKNTTEK